MFGICLKKRNQYVNAKNVTQRDDIESQWNTLKYIWMYGGDLELCIKMYLKQQVNDRTLRTSWNGSSELSISVQ